MRNNPPYEIRLYRHPEDYAAVVHLWEHAGPGIHVRRSDQPEEIAKKLQRDPDLFLVAQDGSQIVGTVLGGFDGRRGMVYHLAVAEAYRQQGLGAALMQELEDRLRQQLVAAEGADHEALHAHEGAARLSAGLVANGVELAVPTEANEVFVNLSPRVYAEVSKHYSVHKPDPLAAPVRFVCSWATTAAEVDTAVDVVRAQL